MEFAQTGTSSRPSEQCPSAAAAAAAGIPVRMTPSVETDISKLYDRAATERVVVAMHTAVRRSGNFCLQNDTVVSGSVNQPVIANFNTTFA